MQKRLFTWEKWPLSPAILILVATLILAACSQPTSLERIQQENVLHVVTFPASTVYVEENGKASGFEYELAQLFAEHLGVELRLEVVEELPELFSRLNDGHTHFAAGGLGIDHTLETRYRLGPTYTRTRPVVVYNSDNGRPGKLSDLADRTVAVRSGGPLEHALHRVSETIPSINWELREDPDPTELLHQLNEGYLDVAIVSENALSMNQVFFPKVHKAFPLASPQPVAWLFPADTDDSLMMEARAFFQEIRRNGVLEQVKERHYGHLDRLDYVGARTFVRHLENRLPQYKETFMEAADAHDMDWRLLAAIGYQESHWRRDAVSPTGVRGLMMLTQPTAAFVGVDNRLDPHASIWGGARFFKFLLSRIPERIGEPDRTWFALAAYNVGLGHLEDARRLTQRAGDDPDRWMHVKEHLPKLAQRKWYTQTRHGYARGHEPVIYTQNIRRYYDVLKWMYPEDMERPQMAEGQESPLQEELDLDLLQNEKQAEEAARVREQSRVISITPPTL